MLIAGADLPLSFSPHHGAADEHTVGAAVVLCEYCLVLTPRSVVARKALAGPLRVVTNAAARAIGWAIGNGRRSLALLPSEARCADAAAVDTYTAAGTEA